MLTIIIFSKDRPLQLDLTLQSLYRNFLLYRSSNLYVIYDSSNQRFQNSYERLMCEHSKCNFIEGLNGGSTLNFICKNSKDPFLMFLTDDNIVYRKNVTTEQDLTKIFDRNIASLSMRLGLNIKNQGVEKPYQQPEIEMDGIHIVWDRMSMPASSYWNYPLSLDGHIFMNKTICPIIEDIFLQNKLYHPNKIEQMLQRYFFEVPRFMAAEVKSSIVNSPNNRVQELVENWFGKVFPARPEELLLRYEAGERIDLDLLNFSDITLPHKEINILEGLR